MTSEVKSKFNEVYGDSRNFMTPHLIRHGKQGKFFYELSEGSAIQKNKSLYGVTVLDTEEGGDITLQRKAGVTIRSDLSTCFFSKEDAEDYIKTLRKRSKTEKEG